jgi:hypothetical protein
LGFAVIADVTGMAAYLLVAARTEGVLAILGGGAVARQQHNANVAVHPRIKNGFGHLVDGPGTEGVADFRAVKGDTRDAIALVIGDVFVRFGDLPVD